MDNDVSRHDNELLNILEHLFKTLLNRIGLFVDILLCSLFIYRYNGRDNARLILLDYLIYRIYLIFIYIKYMIYFGVIYYTLFNMDQIILN